MAVAVELAVHVSGDTESDRSMREHLAWADTIKGTADYEDLLGFVAMMYARSCWRRAEQIREREADRARRRAAALERRRK